LPTRGGYNVKEVFGELRIPLVRDRFIHRLELNGAGRYSDYSLGNVGGVWTYTGGAEFAPVRDLTFRGQYARSVRAPNVQDLFGGNATGFPGAQDPCSDRGPANTRTDALRALCIASGVPAANVFTRAVQPSAQIQVNSGGNPNVREETSDTYTFGAVISPTFIPRLNITVDYFNIKVDGAIGTRFGGAQTALELCYYTARDLTDPVCSIFNGSRGATGAIGQTNGGVNPSFVVDNTASLKTSGIDMQVDYTVPLGFSFANSDRGARLNFSYLGTYLDKYRTVAYSAFPNREVIGEGTFELPKYKHTTRLSLSDGPGILSLRWRYLGKGQDTRIQNVFLGEVRTGTDPALLPNRRLGAANYFDLTASFDVNDNLTFNIGVNNLLDKQPPILGTAQEQANTRPSFYDVLGRDFFVSARIRM
jgi:outer membrane receptor protein involved in Fe transport